ncbi:hypothetical protein Ddye_014014 [Dipteronia dyeriana]|uniref:RNase H type-1 domain-containing protein n=1 Tax=Dipteronia dyeriana TaxID=168575 RepID=A0AAD9X815_9ROSI|nr:hypothetical protein Ddye_014014 [Dipteronia dyeriana]
MRWWSVNSSANKNDKDWFCGWYGLCPSSNMRRAWSSMFYAIVWSIWEARNHMVFKGLTVELSLVIDSVRFKVAWWFKHHGKGSTEPITILMENLEICCCEASHMKVVTAKKWRPPPEGSLKFNVDRSFIVETGKAGIGGILRNSKGEVLCSFSASVASMEATAAELLAIHWACLLCASNISFKGISICIESDSKVAIEWVKQDDFGYLPMVQVIYDIRATLRRLGNLSVCFTQRESNSDADALAKRGLDIDGEVINWLSP